MVDSAEMGINQTEELKPDVKSASDSASTPGCPTQSMDHEYNLLRAYFESNFSRLSLSKSQNFSSSFFSYFLLRHFWSRHPKLNLVVKRARSSKLRKSRLIQRPRAEDDILELRAVKKQFPNVFFASSIKFRLGPISHLCREKSSEQAMSNDNNKGGIKKPSQKKTFWRLCDYFCW